MIISKTHKKNSNSIHASFKNSIIMFKTYEIINFHRLIKALDSKVQKVQSTKHNITHFVIDHSLVYFVFCVLRVLKLFTKIQ